MVLKTKNRNIRLQIGSKTSKSRTHNQKDMGIQVKIHNSRSQTNKTERKEAQHLSRTNNSPEDLAILERILSNSNQRSKVESKVTAGSRNKINKSQKRRKRSFIHEISNRKILKTSAINPGNLSKNKWKDISRNQKLTLM